MPSNATLVRTTQFGARPLGVRGEPLHQAQAQIRDVVRRRLGERHVNLLAEPQAYPSTGRIDWYAAGDRVRAAADLAAPERDALRAEVDSLLADIERLGQQLQASPGEDARLAGRALQLAARRPDSDDYLFRVDDQPVLICWGYDRESVGAILPPAFIASAAPPPAEPGPMPVPAPTPGMGPPAATMADAATATPARFPWLAVLLVGLLGIALILGTGYGLRLFLPVPPDLQVTQLPPEPPPPPLVVPDPTADLRKALDGEHDREGKLKASLVALHDEFEQRRKLCKAPEPPPKPPAPPKPPVAERKPEPKPVPKPKVAEAPKPPPEPRAPPVTRPPPGLMPCNVETASGGAGVTRNRHYVGDRPGQVTIRYNMKMIPDQMNVYYRGQLVATTRHPTSFFGELSFNYQPVAGDHSVTVEVVGPRRGTEWSYRLDCPA
jgi:hypothetical protein